MEENDNLAYKDRSLDELIGHLASDMQGDGQYNQIRYPQSSAPPTQLIGQDYPNENIDPSFLPRRNVYYQDNYQNQSLPFILNPQREDVMPGMVDMRGGDYVIFGTPHAQKNQNGHNLNFINKTNGTLTGFNDYGMEYSGADYNLFSGISTQRHPPVPQFPRNAGTHLRINLAFFFSYNVSIKFILFFFVFLRK